MRLYSSRRPSRLAVFAEAHFALHRLALKAPLEPVCQLRAFSREAAAQPHAIALKSTVDAALEATTDVATVNAVAAREQQQLVPCRSPAVLHIDLPAAGNVGARRRRRFLLNTFRRVPQHLSDAAAGQRLIAGPNRRRTHVERVAIARGVRHDPRLAVEQLSVDVAGGDAHLRGIPLDDHRRKRTGALGLVHRAPDTRHLGDSVADLLEVRPP